MLYYNALCFYTADKLHVSFPGGGGTLSINTGGCVPRHIKKGGLRHGHNPKKGGWGLRHGHNPPKKGGGGLRHGHNSEKGGLKNFSYKKDDLSN